MSLPSSSRSRRLAVWLVAVSVALVPTTLLLVSWSRITAEQAAAWLGPVLYWTMPCLLAVALLAALLSLRGRSRALARAAVRAWPGALLAIALTALVVWIAPPRMRVQFDETSLLGASQNMSLQRQALMTTGAIPFDGELVMLENTVDKRPPLFAFLVSLLHDARGYRVDNAFLLNGGLLALALVTTFAAVRVRLGTVAALAAPALLVAVPLTVFTATSVGFELMAAVGMLLVVLAAEAFVRTPDGPRFAALFAAGVLFMNARYESLPAVAVLGAFVLGRVRGRFRPGAIGWLLLSTLPGLLTPLLLLLQYAQAPRFYPEAAGQPLLAVAHLGAHAGPWLAAVFAPGSVNMLPGLLAWFAVPAVLLRWWRGGGAALDWLAGVPVATVTLVALAWFYGDVAEPTALRLFLPFAWLCALAPLALPATFGPRLAWPLLIAAGTCAGLRLAACARGDALPDLRLARMVDGIAATAQRLDQDALQTLWVSATAQHLVTQGHAALCAQSFERLAQDARAPLWRGGVREVYLVTTPIDAAMAPAFGSVADLVRRLPTEVVERVGGAMPFTVYHLRR